MTTTAQDAGFVATRRARPARQPTIGMVNEKRPCDRCWRPQALGDGLFWMHFSQESNRLWCVLIITPFHTFCCKSYKPPGLIPATKNHPNGPFFGQYSTSITQSSNRCRPFGQGIDHGKRGNFRNRSEPCGLPSRVDIFLILGRVFVVNW